MKQAYMLLDPCTNWVVVSRDEKLDLNQDEACWFEFEKSAGLQGEQVHGAWKTSCDDVQVAQEVGDFEDASGETRNSADLCGIEENFRAEMWRGKNFRR
jgi:hypothetical protein